MQADLALPLSLRVPTIVVPSKLTSPKPKLGKPLAPVITPAPLLLFGRDERGRPHGAHFMGGEAAAVERAADLMDFYFVAAETDVLRDLGSKLPAGRLFPASGKAFVPFIKVAFYEQLLAATGNPDAPMPVKAASKPTEAGAGAGANQGSGAGGSGAGDPPVTRVGAKVPSDWSQIGLGSLVLAQGDEEEDEGYYAAKVLATKAGDHFVLAWAEYPSLPEFTRSRRALALLHPEAAAGLA